MIGKIETKLIWLFAVIIKTTIVSYELGIVPLCHSGRNAYVRLNFSVLGLFSFERVITMRADTNQHFNTDEWNAFIKNKTDIGKGLFK